MGIYIRSSAVPDLYDIHRFVADVTADKTTDQDKALALWEQAVILLPYSQAPYYPLISEEVKREVEDPILLWNVFGFGYCSFDAHALQACFKELGWPARNWEIYRHTVVETWYDNAWHSFDAAHERYFPHPEDGHIASREELLNDHDRVFFNNIKDYFPAKRIPATKSIQEEFEMYTWQNGEKDFLGMAGMDEFDYGHIMDITLRAGESFTRYFHPLGETSDYWYGQSLDEYPRWSLPNNDPTPAYANGIYEYSPSLQDGLYQEGVLSEVNCACGRDAGPALQPDSAGTGEVVFRIASPYLITSASLSGTFIQTGEMDQVALYISPYETTGHSWGEPVWTGESCGAIVLNELALTDYVRGRFGYLVRIVFTAAQDPAHAGIEQITFKTIVQNARHALPRLEPGENIITIDNRKEACIQFRPWMSGPDDVLAAAWSYHNIGGGTEKTWCGSVFPIEADTWGEIIYRYDTPRDINGFCFGGHFYIQEQNQAEIAWSWDNSEWHILKQQKSADDEVTFDNVYASEKDLAAGHREIYLRYRLKRNTAGGDHASLTDMHMKVFYAAASDMSFTCTYAWEDNGLQTKTEAIPAEGGAFTIMVNPNRPPTNLQSPFENCTRFIRMVKE